MSPACRRPFVNCATESARRRAAGDGSASGSACSPTLPRSFTNARSENPATTSSRVRARRSRTAPCSRRLNWRAQAASRSILPQRTSSGGGEGSGSDPPPLLPPTEPRLQPASAGSAIPFELNIQLHPHRRALRVREVRASLLPSPQRRRRKVGIVEVGTLRRWPNRFRDRNLDPIDDSEVSIDPDRHTPSRGTHGSRGCLPFLLAARAGASSSTSVGRPVVASGVSLSRVSDSVSKTWTPIGLSGASGEKRNPVPES